MAGKIGRLAGYGREILKGARRIDEIAVTLEDLEKKLVSENLALRSEIAVLQSQCRDIMNKMTEVNSGYRDLMSILTEENSGYRYLLYNIVCGGGEETTSGNGILWRAKLWRRNYAAGVA